MHSVTDLCPVQGLAGLADPEEAAVMMAGQTRLGYFSHQFLNETVLGIVHLKTAFSRL